MMQEKAEDGPSIIDYPVLMFLPLGSFSKVTMPCMIAVQTSLGTHNNTDTLLASLQKLHL